MSIMHQEFVRIPSGQTDRRIAEPLAPKTHIELDKFVTLLRSVNQALSDRQGCLVEVISCHDGEGVSTVCSGLVRAATVAGDGQALICYVGPATEAFTVRNAGSTVATLLDVALGRAKLRDALFDMPSEKCFVCAVCKPDEANWLAINVNILGAIFETMRLQFDLIVVNARSLKHGVLGTAMTTIADGVLLVVEAEHTRTITAISARNDIEAAGGKLLGVVLNKRRFHVPGFIYRRL